MTCIDIRQNVCVKRIFINKDDKKHSPISVGKGVFISVGTCMIYLYVSIKKLYK